MTQYIGSLKGKGSLVAKKRQRKTGGAKNVYILGMSPDLYRADAETINAVLTRLGGEPRYEWRDNAFLFTKRPNAEKAWVWFTLRYA